MKVLLFSSAIALGVLATPPPLHAQTLPDPDVACESLPAPRIYIEAGDTQMTLLADLARDLRDADPPITLIYFPRSTCSLIENVYRGTTTKEAMRYAPSRAQVPDAQWNRTVPRQCSNTAEGSPIDLGIAATFVSSCSQTVQDLKPANIAIFNGPAQAYGFVVPEGTIEGSQSAITWIEAFHVFKGDGPTQNVVPWTNEPNPSGGTPSLYIRRPTTSTLLTIAANVAPEVLPAASFAGYVLEGQADRSTVVIDGVRNAPPSTRDGTIGILGIDLYDQYRNELDMLAYQAKGQDYAYFPDSDSVRRDKRNVRDGHYVPWGYTQYLYETDSSGNAVNDNVQRILDIVGSEVETRLVSQSSVAAGERFDRDSIEILKKNGLVPECAMGVTREGDGTDLSIFTPQNPCGCFYESVGDPGIEDVAGWSSRCKSCDADNDCGNGKCRRGFCEAR